MKLFTKKELKFLLIGIDSGIQLGEYDENEYYYYIIALKDKIEKLLKKYSY